MPNLPSMEIGMVIALTVGAMCMLVYGALEDRFKHSAEPTIHISKQQFACKFVSCGHVATPNVAPCGGALSGFEKQKRNSSRCIYPL